MKQYELMTIYKIELGDQKAKELSQKVSEVLKASGAEIVKNEFWGKRKFAYEIRNKTEGYYDLFKISADPSSLNKLKTKLNLLTDIVRYLVTAQR